MRRNGRDASFVARVGALMFVARVGALMFVARVGALMHASGMREMELVAASRSKAR